MGRMGVCCDASLLTVDLLVEICVVDGIFYTFAILAFNTACHFSWVMNGILQ